MDNLLNGGRVRVHIEDGHIPGRRQTRPTFSPGLIWKEASTNRICLPYCLLMRLNAIISRREDGELREVRPAAPGIAREQRQAGDGRVGPDEEIRTDTSA